MGFRRVKNDGMLMFILRHYGQDAQGRKTTVNYFSTRATAGAANPPRNGEGERACEALPGDGLTAQPDAQHRLAPAANGGGGPGALAAAEASTTTVKTVISGPHQSTTLMGGISGAGSAPAQLAADHAAANVLNAFEGIELDAEAQAQIYRTLEACAERRRALEDDPENDPERFFIGEAETNTYLGELESGAEEDWVEYKPEGEHRWESLGEGGQAAEIDRVVAGIEERRAALTPEQIAAERAEYEAERARMREARANPALPKPEPDPDDPRSDWRNWSSGSYVAPEDPPLLLQGRGTAEAAVEGHSSAAKPVLSDAAGSVEGAGGRPRKRYKKRTPKPPFNPPNAARKAQAVAEVEAERRDLAAAEAERRRLRKGGQ